MHPKTTNTAMEQLKNVHKLTIPKTEQWVKRDTKTGQFIDVNQDGQPFKVVRKEK